MGWPQPARLDVGDAAVDHLVQDEQHVPVDDAVEQDARQEPLARQEMHHVVEQLLGLFVAGAVDDALGVDKAVQSAEGIESPLLERRQPVCGTPSHWKPCLW